MVMDCPGSATANLMAMRIAMAMSTMGRECIVVVSTQAPAPAELSIPAMVIQPYPIELRELTAAPIIIKRGPDQREIRERNKFHRKSRW